MTEECGDPILEFLGQHVLEDLGLVVDLVPRHPHHLGQIRLEEAVMADHLESDIPALGEGRAPVGDVLHQPHRGELLQHVRRRGGRHPQAVAIVVVDAVAACPFSGPSRAKTALT